VFPWKFKGGEAAFCRAVAIVDDQPRKVPRRPAKPAKRRRR